jgi:hypothetical protein
MAETIEGGATVNVVGTGKDAKEIWVDANGERLEDEEIAEAKRLLAEHAQELEEANRVRLEQDAQRDPTARAIASLMAGARSAAGRVEAPREARPSMQPSGKRSQATEPEDESK